MAKFTGQTPEFPRQCEAASRTDPTRRCRKHANAGSNVCGSHGGSAPQVKQSARLRLASLVDPAIDFAVKYLKPAKNAKLRPELQWAVAKDILDRNGLKGREELVLTHEFDSSRFAHMSDEDIEQLVTLARKASVPKDARGQQS